MSQLVRMLVIGCPSVSNRKNDLALVAGFSRVAKLTTSKLLLSIAAMNEWHLAQLDVNIAFFNRDLFEVYMDLPLGYPC